jgi:hypothetical protein
MKSTQMEEKMWSMSTALTRSFLAAALMVILLSPADAQFGGLTAGIPGLGQGGGAGSGTQASPAELSADLAALSKTFAASFQAMLQAESRVAEAFGLKEQKEKLEQEAAYYAKGNIEDYQKVEASIIVADKAQAAIDSKLAAVKTLDANAKAKLLSAVPYYATGTVTAATLPPQYAAWVQKAQNAVTSVKANPVLLASSAGFISDVPKVAQVSSQLPNLVQKWIGVTKGFVTFAQKQHIDTGDLAVKIGTLKK